MERFYQIVFLVGIFYTVFTFLLGNLFSSFDIDFDMDTDISTDIPWLTISPLKPIVVISFLITFGGVGWMRSSKDESGLMTFFIAVGIAFVVAFLLYILVVVPLYKSQARNLANNRDDIIGDTAEVINAILPGSYGKISYEIKNSRYTASAKATDGQRIDQNEKVMIVKIDGRDFYVEKIRE